MDKFQLSERDICTKLITPAIQQAGWQQHEFREEVMRITGDDNEGKSQLSYFIDNDEPFR